MVFQQPRKSQEKTDGVRKVYQTFTLSSPNLYNIVSCLICCFEKLSLIVVGTGFLFSFVFHWGTVEPVSSAGTRRKEQEQGQLVKNIVVRF